MLKRGLFCGPKGEESGKQPSQGRGTLDVFSSLMAAGRAGPRVGSFTEAEIFLQNSRGISLIVGLSKEDGQPFVWGGLKIPPGF